MINILCKLGFHNWEEVLVTKENKILKLKDKNKPFLILMCKRCEAIK